MGALTQSVRALAVQALVSSGIARTAPMPGARNGGRTFLGWGGDYVGGATPFRLPNEMDYEGKVGDGSGTSLITAAVNWMGREIIPARRVILAYPGDDLTGVPQTIRKHAALQLLSRPNPFYDGTTMAMAMAASWIVDGNVYRWKIRSEVGRVVAYWYLPHWCVTPIGDRNFIDFYRYTVGGTTIEIKPEDVDHLRFGLDPNNPRKGMSPIRGVLRELFTDEEAARFSAALLHNVGFPGAVIIPGKDVEVEPEDRKDIKARFSEEFAGDGRGRAIVLSANAEVKFLSWTPQEMDLSAIRDVPEERVSAAIGIPAAVLGFGTGLQQVKVGATMRELRSMGWEGALIPFLEAVAMNETESVLPEFIGDSDLPRHEVAWDLSRIAALSDIRLRQAEAEATMVRSGIKKVDEARMALGLPAVGGTAGGFMAQPGVGGGRGGDDPSTGGRRREDDEELTDDEDDDEPEKKKALTGVVPTAATSVLTRREHEVAALVARGLTNKEIGSELGISSRTAERQVSSVLVKVGGRSRADIARWMTATGSAAA